MPKNSPTDAAKGAADALAGRHDPQLYKTSDAYRTAHDGVTGR